MNSILFPGKDIINSLFKVYKDDVYESWYGNAGITALARYEIKSELKLKLHGLVKQFGL